MQHCSKAKYACDDEDTQNTALFFYKNYSYYGL